MLWGIEGPRWLRFVLEGGIMGSMWYQLSGFICFWLEESVKAKTKTGTRLLISYALAQGRYHKEAEIPGLLRDVQLSVFCNVGRGPISWYHHTSRWSSSSACALLHHVSPCDACLISSSVSTTVSELHQGNKVNCILWYLVIIVCMYWSLIIWNSPLIIWDISQLLLLK